MFSVVKKLKIKTPISLAKATKTHSLFASIFFFFSPSLRSYGEKHK